MNTFNNFQSLKNEDDELLKNEADELLKNKNYSKAQQIYEKLWIEYRDKWEGWRYAYCLKKAKEYHKAIDICREVYKIDSAFERNNSIYAWCIYHTEIKKENINEDGLLKAGEAILKLCQQDNKYSPYTRTVFKILNFFKQKAIFPHDKILFWLEKLDPNKLSFETSEYKDSNNKLIKTVSDKENYYSYKSKALRLKKEYKKCIEDGEKILNIFENKDFHNNIWIKRNIALSYIELDQKEKGLKILLEILPYKPDWFIYKDISDIYFYQKKYDKALHYAIKGADLLGDDDKKINLYFLLGQILDKKQKNDEAKKHFEFVCQLKNWKIQDSDKKLKSFITKYNIVQESNIDSEKMKKEVRQIWTPFKARKNGIIKNILPTGKAGFLKSNDTDYYFKIKNLKPWHKEGQQVTFEEIEGYDKKKEKSNINAINLKPY